LRATIPLRRIDHQILRFRYPERDIALFKRSRAVESATSFDSVGHTHLGNVSTPLCGENGGSVSQFDKSIGCYARGYSRTRILLLSGKKRKQRRQHAVQLAQSMGGSARRPGRAAATYSYNTADYAEAAAMSSNSCRELVNVSCRQPRNYLTFRRVTIGFYGLSTRPLSSPAKRGEIETPLVR
jgi:hypothetical protein